MGAIETHRDLVAWQRAMTLVVAVYRHTKTWPKEEMYGLTSQARRAAVSVPANIAEGYGRQNLGSYIHFLKIAQGSLKELETHFEIAARVDYIDGGALTEIAELCEGAGKPLRGLISKLSETD